MMMLRGYADAGYCAMMPYTLRQRYAAITPLIFTLLLLLPALLRDVTPLRRYAAPRAHMLLFMLLTMRCRYAAALAAFCYAVFPRYLFFIACHACCCYARIFHDICCLRAADGAFFNFHAMLLLRCCQARCCLPDWGIGVLRYVGQVVE